MSSPSHTMLGMDTQMPWPLEIGGREYPADFKQIATETPKSADRISDSFGRGIFPAEDSTVSKPSQFEQSVDAVVEEVEAVLLRHLAIAETAGTYRDFQTLFKDFSTSINFLRDCRTQFREAIESLWRLNTEFHCKDRLNKAARDAFLKRHYETLARLVEPTFKPLDISLSAQVEDMLLGIAEVALRTRLHDAAHRIAVEICDILDEFTKHAVVGVWKQVTPTACDAYFFRYVIVQENHGQQVVLSEPQVLAVHDRTMTIVKEIGQIETKISFGTHTKQLAVHQLYLSQTETYAVGNYSKTIPLNIKRYLEQLPDWLRDCVRIIGGSRMSMRIIVRDLMKEDFSDVRIKPRPLYEETIRKGCPLVTIGHYVLAGWGEEEDRQEDARQWASALGITSYLLLALACGLMVMGGWFAYGSAIAAGLGMIAHIESKRLKFVSQKQPLRWRRIVVQSGGWFLLAVGLLTLTQGCVNGSLFMQLAGLGCIALMALVHFLRHTYS